MVMDLRYLNLVSNVKSIKIMMQGIAFLTIKNGRIVFLPFLIRAFTAIG